MVWIVQRITRPKSSCEGREFYCDQGDGGTVLLVDKIEMEGFSTPYKGI